VSRPAGTHRPRGLVAGLVLAAAWGTGAAPAGASEVAVDTGRLVFRAAPREANVVVVEPRGLSGYDVFDDGAPLRAGDGCRRVSARHARCSDVILSADIDVADRDDIVEAAGLPIPVTATGGPGVDILEGGVAQDTLSGDDGIDTVLGGGDNDRLNGGEGSDQIDGEDGKDLILGGPGPDVADGGGGDGDVVSGGPGADLVSGGPGDDQVNGDDGDDAMTAGGGSDTVMTGPGADSVFVGTDSTSSIDCRPGDAVRAGDAPLEPGCVALSPHTPAPTVWPPPAARVAAAAGAAVAGRAAQIAPPSPSGRVVRRGHSSKIKVRIPSVDNRPVRVRIRPFDRRGRPFRAFVRVVPGRFPQWIASRPAPSRTWRVRVERA
jgi:hypothetical protein